MQASLQQIPAEQYPDEHWVPDPHAVPDASLQSGSLSDVQPSGQTPSAAPHVETQRYELFTLAQTGVVPMHLVAQAPQAPGSVSFVSQPSSLFALVQFPYPSMHEESGTTHLPPSHWTGAPGRTFGNRAQSWPHEPQF